jgi:putative membrane protein
MKRGTWVFLLAAFTLVATVSCEKDENENDDMNVYNQNDSTFVLMASISNFAEIAIGQIAINMAEDTAVIAYGQAMIDEHTTAGQELKSIANSLQLPTKDSLDTAHQMLKDTLLRLTGPAFDTAYVNSQILDHEQAITLFRNEADNGQNDRLKKFANDMLPHLNMHLQAAQALAGRLD